MMMVDTIELPKIRCGDIHEFTDVWMVTMKGRIFARSGRYVPSDSWYDAFRENPFGAIKLTDTIVSVLAKVPEDLSEINSAINEAYYLKYGKKYPYLMKGITDDALMKHTMEFVPCMR